MANIIYGGVDAFDAVAYGEQNYNNQLFFKSQVEAASQIVSNIGQQLFASSAGLYERYNGSDALRVAKAAIRAVGGMFVGNHIQPLTTIGKLQQAPMVMQNWVMANPLVRALYFRQRCDGYSDTYVDMHPGQIAEDHEAYREVMNGIVVEDSEGNSRYTTYMLEENVGVRPLAFEDQCDILTTWDVVEGFINAGLDDPTSPFNAKL